MLTLHRRLRRAALGRTADVLGQRVMAPSTLRTFLRAFTFGHVRHLDRVLDEALRRACTAGAGPGEARLVVDVDSFVGETFGPTKQGAAFGYTRVRGYHPILVRRYTHTLPGELERARDPLDKFLVQRTASSRRAKA